MKKESKLKTTTKLKRKINMIWPIVAVWGVVFVVCIVVFVIGEPMAEGVLRMPNYRMLTIILAFATFVMTTLFSFLILSHNMNTRHMSAETTKSAEEFRELQFVSSNYTVIDFRGEMQLYEQYGTYTSALKATMNFNFYLRQDSIEMKDVIENFDDYAFLSVKLPYRVVEGKTLSGVRISRFRFTRDNAIYRFVPCAGGINTFVLHDDSGKDSVVVVNLIIKKDGDFYSRDAVTPFRKIKLNLSMCSLLGVEVSGWTELYFTNPRKLEKDGTNLYKINSSQFKISGLPTLAKIVKPSEM